MTVSGQMDVIDEPDKIRSTLVLPALKRSDYPLTLSCSASNADRSRPLEQSFDIDMQRESFLLNLLRVFFYFTFFCAVPPVSLNILVGERNPTAGKPFYLPCHIVGSRPIPKIIWWMNDILLDPSQYNQV